MLVYVGIIPFRLYNFRSCTNSIGVSITPIQLPFTNIFVLVPNSSVEHSNNIRIEVLILSHFIIG